MNIGSRALSAYAIAPNIYCLEPIWCYTNNFSFVKRCFPCNYEINAENDTEWQDSDCKNSPEFKIASCSGLIPNFVTTVSLLSPCDGGFKLLCSFTGQNSKQYLYQTKLVWMGKVNACSCLQICKYHYLCFQ